MQNTDELAERVRHHLRVTDVTAVHGSTLLVLAIVLLPWTGVCVADEGSVTVTDAAGRLVEMPDVPERIVIAGKAVVMIIDALYLFRDVGPRVAAVGVTDQGLGDFFPVLDPDPDRKIRLGKNAGPEEILAARPDLVLLKSYMRESLGLPLEKIGVPVVYLDLETPEQFRRDMRILSGILRQEERAGEIERLFELRERRLEEAVGDAGEIGVAVLSFNRLGEGHSVSVSPEGWMQGEQVRLAGGEPVWYSAASAPGWNRVQFEQIAAWNPEAIILLSYRIPSGAALEEVLADPLWRRLEAVKENRVYAMPADFYSWGQPDPRWILGAEWMAAKLHPERFPGPFIERIRLFFREFYGLGDRTFETEIRPVLSGDIE